MAESEFANIAPEQILPLDGLGNGLAQRAPWSTPRVIASELSAARAHVGHGHDGSSPHYGPYGS